MNVDRVGNIFIHRDVDAGMERNVPLNNERIEEINDDIGAYVAAGGD